MTMPIPDRPPGGQALYGFYYEPTKTRPYPSVSLVVEKLGVDYGPLLGESVSLHTVEGGEPDLILKTSAPQWGRKDRLFDGRSSDKSRDFRSFAGLGLARPVGSRRNFMSDTTKSELPRIQLSA